MILNWPDPISFVADLIAIIGIPTLYVSTRSLYKEAKKAREPQSVGHGCLEFSYANMNCAINLIPLNEVAAIPRPGDHVFLPGETRNGKNFGAGLYEVEDVAFRYNEARFEVDQPCPALPSRIMVRVRSLNSE